MLRDWSSDVCSSDLAFYTQHIKSNPEWEFVDVYTDEGISGTNTRKREGFNRMVEDALNGKIDLILTKSISRFARNTVDTLTTIRKLKEKKVEVYFEKENIYTLDAKGEVMLTIMSSLAQEESRSISENVTWGKRKSMVPRFPFFLLVPSPYLVFHSSRYLTYVICQIFSFLSLQI